VSEDTFTVSPVDEAWVASLAIALRFLAFGLIYKYTKNSVGPMVGWTITNDFIWFLLGVLNL
jgi:hypothetical protein